MNQEVKNWLEKASNDFKTIEKLMEGSEEDIVTDSVCFHSEQFVEKSLKAFLINHEIDFKKNHDLVYLVELCSEIDKDFQELTDLAKKLTFYAVEIRYPDDFYMPTLQETKESIAFVKQVKKFIEKRLILALGEI